MAVPLEILQKRRTNLSPGHVWGLFYFGTTKGTKSTNHQPPTTNH
jgi:hypothetical protein